jgi:hypothetical protein
MTLAVCVRVLGVHVAKPPSAASIGDWSDHDDDDDEEYDSLSDPAPSLGAQLAPTISSPAPK